MTTCPKYRSYDTRENKAIRNDVIYTVYICNSCGCEFYPSQQKCL